MYNMHVSQVRIHRIDSIYVIVVANHLVASCYVWWKAGPTRRGQDLPTAFISLVIYQSD